MTAAVALAVAHPVGLAEHHRVDRAADPRRVGLELVAADPPDPAVRRHPQVAEPVVEDPPHHVVEHAVLAGEHGPPAVAQPHPYGVLAHAAFQGLPAGNHTPLDIE